MLVNVLKGQPFGDHQYLQVVEQLGNLLGRGFIRFILGSHPDLGSFLNHFLADTVDAGFKFGDGSGASGPGCGFLTELGKKGFEGLHGIKPTG
jgi:hypothetical protein